MQQNKVNSKRTQLFLLNCESNTHVGSDRSDGGADALIQRDSVTGFPIIEASSFKGAVKSALRDKVDLDDLYKAFGSHDNGDQASTFRMTELKILLFPVMSIKGIFAWVTCPFVLSELAVTLGQNDLDSNTFKDLALYDMQDIMISSLKSNVIINTQHKMIGLDEFGFQLRQRVSDDDNLEKLAQKMADKIYPVGKGQEFNKRYNDHMKNSIVVISDEDFTYLVRNKIPTPTQNKIDESTGTTADTALFQIEYLPSRTVFFGTMTRENYSDPNDVLKEKVAAKMANLCFQIGAKKTLGKGNVKLVFA